MKKVNCRAMGLAFLLMFGIAILMCAVAENSATSTIFVYNQGRSLVPDGQDEIRALRLSWGTNAEVWHYHYGVSESSADKSGYNTMGNVPDSSKPDNQNWGSGCGAYTQAHAIQWLNQRAASDPKALIEELIAVPNGKDPWDSASNGRYNAFVKSKTGADCEYLGVLDESRMYSILTSGGCITMNIPGHYILAVGAVKANLTGTTKTWFHIVDSSCTSTLKRLSANADPAYNFSMTGKAGTMYYAGGEYWISYDACLASKITPLYAFTKSSGSVSSSIDLISYENCTYKVIKSFTFRDDMYGSANSVGDPVPVGSYITVREVWKNKYGNMWVKTVDNKWVYAGWKYESGSWCQDGDQYLQFYSDNNKVAWDDNNLDGQIVPYGKPYTLAGRITSDASLVSVQGEFTKGAACWGNPTSAFGAYGTSYDVPNSDLDHALSFAALPESSDLGLRITVKYRYNRGFEITSKTIQCAFSNVQGTFPTGHLLDPIVFNLDYYLEANPDVKAMNWSADVVRKHWLQNGISEGRVASPAFDVAYYVNQNADLQGFSGNYAGAIEHYCTNGVYESRPTSSIFNIAQYKTNYPDLAESLSNDDYEIAYHFVGAGYKEGRIANRPLMVYFDGNGGSVATGSKAIQKSRKYGTLPTPTRSGHSFDGWYTASSGGTRVTEDTIHDSIHELTLYAHWSEENTTPDRVPVIDVTVTPYFTVYGDAVYIGREMNAAATVYPSNATDKTVTWSSSNTAVATVTAMNGSEARIVGVSKGTAVITCRTNDGGYTSSFTVNVLKDVTGIQISPTTLTLNVGDTYRMSSTVLPTDASNQTVHWSSSDTTVVATDYYEVGTIKALKIGSATVTAMSERGGYTVTCAVTVVQPIWSITLSSSSLSMNVGDAKTISANISPSTATNQNVQWSTSNSAVATVSSGRITAVGAGTVTITCAATDGSGISASCAVTVTDAHVHTSEMIAPIPASSTENGRTFGLRCRDCNEILLYQAVIDKGRILSLPKAVQCIEEEAFAGAKMEQVNIPESVTDIGARAFADCRSLKLVTIPDGVTKIADNAFDGCNDPYFCIVADAGSVAARYAGNHGYRLWSPVTTYTVHFDLNGGSGSITDLVVENGAPLGTLPSAVRDYYSFAGWFTKPTGGSRVNAETVYDNRTEALTLYAQWTENGYSEWVTEASVPSGARIVDTKTQYRYRDTTYSTVYSSWSAWGDWTITRETTSDLKKEEVATVYGWYWFQCPNCGAHWHVWSGLAIDCSPTWGPGGGCGNDNIQSTDGHIVWNTTPWSSGTADWYGTGRICQGSDIKTRMFAWTDGGSAREGYRYATRTSSQQANIGAWSSWSDTAVSSSSTREVETRKLVRYQVK